MAPKTMLLIEDGTRMLGRLTETPEVAEVRPGHWERGVLRSIVLRLRVGATQEAEVEATIRKLDRCTADQVTVRRASVSEGRMPWRCRT